MLKKEEESPAIRNNVGESGGHYAKWEKPAAVQTLRDSVYMECPREWKKISIVDTMIFLKIEVPHFIEKKFNSGKISLLGKPRQIWKLSMSRFLNSQMVWSTPADILIGAPACLASVQTSRYLIHHQASFSLILGYVVPSVWAIINTELPYSLPIT